MWVVCVFVSVCWLCVLRNGMVVVEKLLLLLFGFVMFVVVLIFFGGVLCVVMVLVNGVNFVSSGVVSGLVWLSMLVYRYMWIVLYVFCVCVFGLGLKFLFVRYSV